MKTQQGGEADDKTKKTGAGASGEGEGDGGEADKKKKAAASQEDDDSGDGGSSGSEPEFTEEQKKYVEKLRKEAAGWRTKHKDLVSKHDALGGRLSKLESGFKKALGIDEGEKLTEEELEGKLGEAQGRITELETRAALTEMALENGLGKEDVPYMAFLLNQASQELADGEELSEEQVQEILDEAKAKSKSGKKSANSSVNKGDDEEGDGGENPPPPEDKKTAGAVTLEKFAKMNTTERSLLYTKNPKLYSDLMNQAKEKRTFVR